jgi:hypothetical protein
MSTIICPGCGAENSQYGVCDYCGTKLIEPSQTDSTKQTAKISAEEFASKISKYQEVKDFIGGVAIVSIGNQYGAINENGDLIVPMTSKYVYNFDGLVLAGDQVLYDPTGCVMLQSEHLYYLGLERLPRIVYFLMEDSEGNQQIAQINHFADGKKSFFEITKTDVNLPDGIQICYCKTFRYTWIGEPSSLGNGYFVVQDNNKRRDDRKNKGIATADTIVLDCNFEKIDNYHYLPKMTNNKNISTIKKLVTIIEQTSMNRQGIFNLETRKMVLPCQYVWHHTNKINSTDECIVITHGTTHQMGVFNVVKQEFVVPAQYRSIVLLDNHRCEATKKGFWGDKKTIIQL